MRVVYISRSRLHKNRANLVQTIRTAEAFVRMGVDLRLFMPPWKGGGTVAGRLSDLGVQHAIDIRVSPWLHSRFRLWPFVLIHRKELLAADAVYVRSVDLSVQLCRNRVPHVLEVHAIDGTLVNTGRMETVVAAQRAGMIRHLLPISRAARARLVAAGADAARVHVAPSGVDLDAFGIVPPLEPETFRQPRVIHVGSLSQDRGLAILQALVDSGVATVTLVGASLPELRERPGLSVVGYVSHREVPAWYGRSDVAVIPYQRDLDTVESMSPVKLFEAMGAGRVVVASDLPAIREIIVDGENGLLVEPDDVEAWIATVRRLRDDPHLAVKLAAAARASAEQYSWRRRAEKIAEACGWVGS